MKLKEIILVSLLLASTIIINRFLSINTGILSIGFTFVPLILSEIILGVKKTVLIATLADLIGAFLFPFGPFFIGYTISAMLTGLVYGLFLYQKGEFNVNKKFIIRLVLATLIVTLIIHGGLNTLWTILTVKSASVAIIPMRIIKQLIMIPVMILTMLGLTKILKKEINVMKND